MYCEKMWLSVTLVYQFIVIKFIVKEKELKCSERCVYVLELRESEGG
jgi:hypothetical protein